jgi:hypothetical protein
MTIQNLKLRIIPKFPASVSVGSGLTLTNTAGAYSITLANNLTQVAALTLGPNQAIYWPSLGVAGSYSITSIGRTMAGLSSAPTNSVLIGGNGSPSFTDTPTVTSLTLANGQIAFPATQVASANANTLDDYEEGTWTPVMTFATPGNLSISAYAVQVGAYTKIGRSATLSFNISISAGNYTQTTASGALQVTGIPFAALGTANLNYEGAVSAQGVTKASYTSLVARLTSGASILDFVAFGSGQAVSNVAAADTPTGGAVALGATITHFTA